MTLRLGAHVDSVNPLAEAAALDAGVVQVFLGDPQSWKKPATLYPDGAAALQEAAAAAKRLTLDTIYFLKGAEA